MSWNSRTAGAPSLPVASEEEMTLEDLRVALASGAIDEAVYQAAVARMRSRVASEGARPAKPRRASPNPENPSEPNTMDALRGTPIAKGYGNRQARLPSGAPGGVHMTPDEIAAMMADSNAYWQQEAARRQSEAADRQLGPGPMTGTTEEYQDYAGIPRSPTSRLQDEGRDMANRRAYGARAGGGEAFASEEERDAYGRRNVLPQSERNEMAAQGMTPGQIVDAQRSQADRDMAKAGISGSAGWAPVYVNGRVVYMERAPDDTRMERRQNPSQPPAKKPSSQPAGTQSFLRSSPNGQAPGTPSETAPEYSYEPRHEIGMTNAADGNRRVGPRVDDGELSLSLGTPGNEVDTVDRTGTDRRDLRDRGYRQQTMMGPYGPERVWVKEDLGEELRSKLVAEGMPQEQADAMTLQQYQQQQRTEGTKRRLMQSGGLSSSDVAGMSVAQIRELSRERRAAQKSELADAARLARLGGRQRNEMALGRMPEDWQNAVMARQFGMGQTTPLDARALEAQRAFEMARGMLQGAEGGMDARMKLAMDQQRESRLIEGRKAAARFFKPGYKGGASMAQRRAEAELELRESLGLDEREIEAILSPYPLSSPGPVPDTQPPNTTGMPAVGPAPPGWPIGRPWPPVPAG